MYGIIKVDILLKDELEFELKLRNVSPPKDYLAKDLRKLLRKALKDCVVSDTKNLQDKIVLSDEYDILVQKEGVIKTLLDEVLENPKPTQVVRVETKLIHLQNRCTHILKFKMEDKDKDMVNDILSKCKIYMDNVNSIAIESNSKEVAYQKLSQSIMEDDEIDDAIQDVEDKIGDQSILKDNGKNVSNSENNIETGLNTLHVSSCDIVRSGVSNASKNTVLTNNPNPIMNFCKLDNPINRYLKMFRVTDGVNIHELLNFLRVCLRIKREVQVNDSDIYDLCIAYAHGMLLNKVNDAKMSGISFDLFHSDLLNCFVPLTLQERLKMDLVLKPQGYEETLSTYICNVRENVQLLKLNLNEKQIVDIIVIGLNPICRSKLVFQNAPSTFKDLDHLCIQIQNVLYSDSQRKPMVVNRSQNGMSSGKVCYICNKNNHIAKDCYKNPKRQVNQNNFRRYDDTNPKNL